MGIAWMSALCVRGVDSFDHGFEWRVVAEHLAPVDPLHGEVGIEYDDAGRLLHVGSGHLGTESVSDRTQIVACAAESRHLASGQIADIGDGTHPLIRIEEEWHCNTLDVAQPPGLVVGGASDGDHAIP